jgi:aspartyl-tRNA(Asn)/glutamyl-tRNA(Gln) amidotransferase subunit A
VVGIKPTFGRVSLAGVFPLARSLDRADRYGTDVRGRLELAGQVRLEDYLQAAEARRRIRFRFTELFRRVDLLHTSVAAAEPVPIGEEEAVHLGRRTPFGDLVLGFAAPQNLAGVPACAFRAGFDDRGLPVGVELTGPPWREGLVLRTADAFCRATEHIQSRWPALEPSALGVGVTTRPGL